MSNVRLSTRGLNIGFIVTSLVLLCLFVTSYHSYQVAGRTLQRYTRMERVLGKIEYDNEASALSARLAAETGKTVWVDRHDRYSGNIAGLIAEVKKIPLIGQEKNFTALDNARKTLTAVETKAMKSVRRSASSEAISLLQSNSYNATLAVFNNARKDLVMALGEQIEDDLSAEMQRNRVAMVGSSICAIISLLAWSMVLSVLKSLTSKGEVSGSRPSVAGMSTPPAHTQS